MTARPASLTAVPAGDPFALVRPGYGRNSLADLLPSVSAVLGVPAAADVLRLAGPLDGVRRVAVLLIDGLGAYQIPVAASQAPVLTDLASGRLGHATTLTSGFPSTTPVSLVTLGAGVPPGAHGVVGFTVRMPGTRQVVNHIRWTDDPDPAAWQPVPTRLALAAAAGVAVTVVMRPEFAGSGLTDAANRGATFRGAADTDELAAGMLAALRGSPGPTLVYGYHPDLDKAGHEHGVDSPEWRTAAADVGRLLGRLLDGLPPDAALLVTADHGQLDVPAGDRVDLDADPRLAAGVVLAAGEPRVRYLHVRDGATADVLAAWREVLGDAAWVGERDEVIADGWFGPVPPAHRDRIGDVVVICRGRHVVLATAREPAAVAAMVAFHGAATATEMTVPLLVARRR